MHSPQPLGCHGRRLGTEGAKAKRADLAEQLVAERVINYDAKHYLVGWGRGTLRREPRPAHYEFLRHRWQQEDVDFVRLPVRYDGGTGQPPRVRVAIMGISGRLLPDHVEDHDGDEELGVFPVRDGDA